MLNKAGVGYTIEQVGPYETQIDGELVSMPYWFKREKVDDTFKYVPDGPQPTVLIKLEALENDLVRGYSGFCASAGFDDEGNLVGFDVWE
jgi:hypothetical protein